MEIIERSLQEIGKSLLVSLPKEWTKKLKLSRGSKIKLRTSEEGNIIIAPEFSKRIVKTQAEVDYDKDFFRNFIRKYFEGYEKIIIKTRNIEENEFKKIHKILSKFMNIQILEETNSSIIIKCFQINQLSIEECLKGMYHISENIINEVLEKNQKTKIQELENSLTKFYFMLVMQIRRFLEEGQYTQNNQISLIRAMDYRMVGEKIERIADVMKNIDRIRDKNIKKIVEQLDEAYSKAFRFFMSREFNESLKINIKKIGLQNLKNKVNKEKNIKLYEQITALENFLSYIKEIILLTR